MKKTLSIILAVLLLLSTFAVCASAASPSLNYTSKTIYYGDKLTLKIKNGTASKWTSSKSDVASVTSKGVVKGLALGTATIKATVGKKTLSCKVKVIDRDVSASVTFKTTTGGAFIFGVNAAKIKFTPKTYNVAKAVVFIKNASGDTVFKKAFTKLAANNAVSFDWDGTNSKGKAVPSGTYKAQVKIGSKLSNSASLYFLTKNIFAGGDGSKKNPFKIATIAQLKQIIKYPNAYFKQIKNLDFDYTAIKSLFTEDKQFNGVYDGGGKTMKNIMSNAPIFSYIAEKGVVKNLSISRSSFSCGSSLVMYNYGKIDSCTFDVSVSSSEYATGGVCYQNNGIILNCKVNGTVNSSKYCTSSGGITAYNNGSIVDCISNANVSKTDYEYAGGISGTNNGSGVIRSCEATGLITSNRYAGGIAGRNDGTIVDCSYTGDSIVNIVGTGGGVVS